MKSIIAILNKPSGRGWLRAWQGFLCDTVIQDDVEMFMCSLGFGCSDYFLADPDKLAKNESGNLVYEKYWISAAQVKVKRTKRGRRFTIEWA